MVMTTVSYFQIQDVPEEVEILCKVGVPSTPAVLVLNALTLSLMPLDRQPMWSSTFTSTFNNKEREDIHFGYLDCSLDNHHLVCYFDTKRDISMRQVLSL